MAYNHKEIEKRAREKWARLDLYTTDLSNESKEPYYLLVEFPYPSGDLHIGHWYAFAVTDIYARLLRMRGKNVLFPIGFDAFGLPAENAAIRNGADPAKWTYENIARMRDQLASMGASFDWSKEVLTCDPNYYQWTQWLFVKLFEHNLAERREAAVKWCPQDQTVLANEQVVDGACERCGTEVEEKRLTQWFLKITNYAERLLTGLDTLPWREEIKDAQRAWIGKSEGAKLKFSLQFAGSSEQKLQTASSDLQAVEVFTTRPDTVFGATYVVLAPEHPLISDLCNVGTYYVPTLENVEIVKAYVKTTAKKTERERSENKEKTGVRIEGVFAINPATKEEIPIYVADYVLVSYGTGAVMAVPAHDERDFEFAKKFNLPIRPVVLKQSEKSRSFVMGVSEEDMINLGVEIVEKTDNGFFKILIPQEKIDSYASFIRERMNPHFWNEFSTPKGFHFIFKHKNGKIEELDLNADTNDLIDRYGMTFNDKLVQSPAQNVYSWLAENSFYKDLLIHTDTGVLINSGEFTGRDSEEAKGEIVTAVGGERTTQYRIRDWLVSRQRYWGCPIPIVYDPSGKPHAVPAEHLPWLLPTDVDFLPKADPPPAGKQIKSPLASSKELQERVTKIFGEGWTPEYDTLDTFVDSSWYFLRYLSSKNVSNFSDAELMKKWLPINRYSGGSEHTTMHLLYARFFMKALYDLALVPVDEPFAERFNRGLIRGPDGAKMSKSKGNVVNPDDFVKEYGADAVRLYLAFIGPYNEPRSYPWGLEGVASMRKFLDRVARIGESYGGEASTTAVEASPLQIEQALAKTALKVAEDGDRFKFNTAIAALMILTNELEALETVPKAALTQLVIMLAPFAPHLAEHLWEKLNGGPSTSLGVKSVHQQSWPTASLTVASEVEVVVQVAGRKRGSIRLPSGTSEAEALAEALKLPAVITALSGNEQKRVVYVPNKIINLVVPR